MKKAVLYFPLSLFLGMFSVFSLLWLTDASITRENGLMENIQAGFLLLALFFTMQRFRTERDWNFVMSLFFLSYLTVFLRELDLRSFALPQFIIFLSSKGRNVALAFGWLWFLYFFIRSYSACLKEITLVLGKASGKYFLLGCLFYGLALPFDSGLFAMNKEINWFFEELLESMGTLSFVLSASSYAREGYAEHENN